MIRTLQRKFVFSAMLAITILLVALLGSVNIINSLIQRREINLLMDMLVMMETTPAMPQRIPPKDGEAPKRQPPNSENAKMSAVYFVTHTNENGQIIYTDVSRIATVTEDTAASMTSIARKDGKINGFRYCSANSEDGKQTVWVFLETSVYIRAVLRLLGVSALIGAMCWLIMLLIVWLLAGRAIRPIAANIERQKQFVTDAGHEIKTPLAIILANTEAMELHNGENKWSRNIRKQVTRLNGLMQNLLTLSKLDEGRSLSNKEDVPFSEITVESVKMFDEAMSLKSLSVTCSIQSDITVNANRDLLVRLLSILLDNAVKYTPNNGHLEITLAHREKFVQLIVANDCDSIPQCSPEKLFDRFYRADLARTQSGGGYGIGLAAARSIADAHGWDITAVYPDDHRIAFILNI